MVSEVHGRSPHRLFRAIVHIGLAVGVTVSLYNGPIQLLRENSTSWITDEIEDLELDHSHYPTLAFCRSLNFGAGASSVPDDLFKFRSHISDEANVNWSTFIKNITVGPDISQIGRLSVDPTMLKPFLTDAVRFGICFALNWSDVIQMMRTELGTEAGNFIPVLGMWPIYGISVVDQGEELVMSGPTNLAEEIGAKITVLSPGEGTFIKVSVEYWEQLRHCNTTQGAKLSKCVEAFLDQLLGHCTADQTIPSKDDDSSGCSAEALYDRYLALGRLKEDGYGVIRKVTHCLLPCNRNFVRVFEVARAPITAMFPTEREYFNDLSSRVMITFPTAGPLPRRREVLSYPFSSFVGEAGGYLGLFLGFSLWGFFDVLNDAAHWIVRNS